MCSRVGSHRLFLVWRQHRSAPNWPLKWRKAPGAGVLKKRAGQSVVVLHVH